MNGLTAEDWEKIHIVVRIFFSLALISWVLSLQYDVRSLKRKLKAAEEAKPPLPKPEKSPKPAPKPPEERKLWKIGDATEVDLGAEVYGLAFVQDFDRDESNPKFHYAYLRFEGSEGKKGFWYMGVDRLRAPRAGSPELRPVKPKAEKPEEDKA